MAKKAKTKERELEPKEGAAAGTVGRRLPLWGIAVLVLQIMLMLTVFNRAAHNGGDTAGYVTLAHSLLDRGTYQDLWQPGQPPHTKYPPVFPILLAVVITLGARTWAALKVVPALFTTLSVMGAYLWARERRGSAFAAAVALLTAVSNAFLWASHWELSDPPFVALTFIALWAYDQIANARPTAGEDARVGATSWLVLGGIATGLAYFTREAGLPLLVAAVAWLLLRKRWRAAVATAGAIGALALLWSLRANEGAQYMSEFWMINPYEPDLGRISFGGLAQRIWQNAELYVLNYVPAGFTGLGRSSLVPLIGVGLFALAVWGWVRRLRSPGVAELFVPMYLGLILLWPQVWSGDRFALPLFPLLLFYAGEVIVHLVQRIASVPVRRAAIVLSILILAIPALGSWRREMRISSGCSAIVRSSGSFACWGSRTNEFVQAALWSGAHLPDSSVVLSRKPRIFYVESGLASETFPFTRDVDRFLAFADSVGAKYVVMDYLDETASVYVGDAVIARGGAFCALQGFGPAEQPQTQILGILPADRRVEAETREENGVVSVAMNRCPPAMTRATALAERSERTEQIPLLVGFR